MRWFVIATGCVVALLAFLLGGLTMSSARRTDLLAGRVIWVFAAAVLALAIYAAVTRSPVALKALTWVVAVAVAALAWLFAAIYFRSR